MDDFQSMLRRALDRRREAVGAWQAEGSDTFRVLHGATEGAPGVAVDRYGPILLLQTWREPLPDGAVAAARDAVCEALGVELFPVWNHRAKPVDFARWYPCEPPADPVAHELGLSYDATPRHRGQDPLLFLDLRVVRRRMLAEAAGRSVLNTFAYTCGVGVCAAKAGASSVWNVDFASSALDVGRRNLALSGLSDAPVEHVQRDCLPTLRQLAGLPLGRARGVPPLAARSFDVVVLDPPRWSTSRFGAVDLVRDYASLFKPAVLCTAPGGVVVATNNVASVDRDGWIDGLRRCAAKAGRPLVDVEVLEPEADFPSPDGRPPLKIAWCRV